MQPQWWLLAAVVVAVVDVKVGFITDKIDREKNLHLGALPAWQAHVNASLPGTPNRPSNAIPHSLHDVSRSSTSSLPFATSLPGQTLTPARCGFSAT